MEALNRMEICTFIAKDKIKGGNKDSVERFAKVFNKNINDRDLTREIAKSGNTLTRLPGGRYYINIELN